MSFIYAKDLQPNFVIRFQADQLEKTDLRTNTALESTVLSAEPYLTYQVKITTVAGALKPVDPRHIFSIVSISANIPEIKGLPRSGQHNDRRIIKGIGID